jgi:hypothetical protein
VVEADPQAFNAQDWLAQARLRTCTISPAGR